jgi:PAS domain-containing protein
LYVVTMRDVTAEQREHQDVKHAYLVVSRILAIADDAIVNVDHEQRITFFNRKAESLLAIARRGTRRVTGPTVAMRYRAAHSGHIAAFQRDKAPSG